MQDYDLKKQKKKKVMVFPTVLGFFFAVKEKAVSCIHENMILVFFKCIIEKKKKFNYSFQLHSALYNKL